MTSMSSYVGRTVTVRNLEATDGAGERGKISGPWEIVDFEGEDRDAGILGEAFTLVPGGTPESTWEALAVDVDPSHLLEQIDPERVARERAAEAAMEP